MITLVNGFCGTFFFSQYLNGFIAIKYSNKASRDADIIKESITTAALSKKKCIKILEYVL